MATDDRKLHLVHLDGKNFITRGAATRVGAIKGVVNALMADPSCSCSLLEAADLLQMFTGGGATPTIIEIDARASEADKPASEAAEDVAENEVHAATGHAEIMPFED